MVSSPGAQSRRLFFALWPDADVRRQLYAAAGAVHAACGGRSMREENLHLTLAFLGAVAPERIATVFDLAATVVMPCFDWQLDRLGSFRRIAWLGGETVPALSELAKQLAQRLRQQGFSIEERPFAAHVTLVRDAHCERLVSVAPPLPIVWAVKEFVLVESQAAAGGVRYVVIGRWPLPADKTTRAINPPPDRASKSK